MSYSIGPNALGSFFAVPNKVVDEHIRLASAPQIKALLWVMRHVNEAFTIEDIAKTLKMDVVDTKDALQYWVENQILSVSGEQEQRELPAIVKKTPKSKENPLDLRESVFPELPELKPTNEQILNRSRESVEIRFLFTEAQIKLGRTIGFEGQATLLMMHDQYGLPVEVILMILEYCIGVGKTNNAYIAKVGKSWGEEEIDSLERADEKIRKLNRCHSAWSEFAKIAGLPNQIPTQKQLTFLQRWINEWKFSIEMIHLAYEEMTDHTQKFSMAYMNKVLLNWKDSSIFTPDDVERQKEKWEKEKEKQAQAKTKAPPKRSASYDLEEYKRKTMTQDPVYKKRDKV